MAHKRVSRKVDDSHMTQKTCEKCKSAIICVKDNDKVIIECSYCGTTYNEPSLEDLYEDDYNE